ncbi:MAG: hypothetical protein M3H12_07415 [Chromatiales bacterium]
MRAPCLAAIQQVETAAKEKQGMGGLAGEVEADLTSQLDRFGRTIKKVFSPLKQILGQKPKDETEGDEKPPVISPQLEFE